MSVAIQNPYPLFLDLLGNALSGGQIFIGQPNLDPQSYPQATYWDAGLTIAAAQPIQVTSGYPYRLGSPATPYTLGPYSMKVLNAQGVQVFYAGDISTTSSSATRDFIDGLTLSTAGSSASMSIAPGQAMDSTNAALIALSASLTKTTSLWAVGNNMGGLDTGTIAPSTWYHCYLILRPDTGVVDALLSSSPTAPSLPTNYTYKRRIGAVRTDGSSQWRKFVQLPGGLFLWDIPAYDYVNQTPSTTIRGLAQVTVPTGDGIVARLTVAFGNPSLATNLALLITSPRVADRFPNGSNGDFTICHTQATNNFLSIQGLLIPTDSSGNIAARANQTSGSYSITTEGWYDARGRDL